MLRSSLAVVAAALAFSVLTSSPCAQDVWSPRGAPSPSARQAHAMAYDSQRGRVVLFGGDDGSQRLGDTWEWDGTVWSQVATTGPAPRAGHAMAYDAMRGKVVLFGGDDGNAELGDTWEWDGSVWMQVSSTGPAARSGHGLVFDAARGTTLLFGGDDGNAAQGDTWQWDGSTWSQLATTGPAPRRGAGLAYDAVRHEVVLFGGEDGAMLYGDGWTWDGSAWTAQAATGPAARSGPAMAFDGHRGRVILFGGDVGATPAADTWEWDGSTWSQSVVSGPTARAGHAMVPDPLPGRITLFGGDDGVAQGDTWTLQCAPWCDLGHGTTGTHGAVQLVGTGPVERGTNLTLTLSNVLANTNAALVVGTSAGYLPFAGGTVVPDPLLVLPASTTGTSGSPATLNRMLTVPATSPPGVSLYLQYWVLDAAAPSGLAASNGLAGLTRRSVYEEIAAAFDARLAAAAPATSSLPIYSVQDFTNLVFVRNPACWAAGYDLSGISPWNQAYANLRAGTLVSPRHLVFAMHYPLSTTPGNNDIAFVTPSGTTVVRKLVAVAYPAADIGVGLLDADVPPDITFYKILPQDWVTHIGNSYRLPMLHLDQEEKALVRDMQTTLMNSSYCFHQNSTSSLRAPFTETLIGGDSGNPAFLLIDGEPILILTHHYATGGPSYTYYASAVNAAMSQLGGGYQLTEVDLSRLPR